MEKNNYPKVGVATLVFHEGKLLLGKRKKLPGMDSWQCPGGLLELGESVFECAHRETLEETGLRIYNLGFGPYTNNHFDDDQEHTVTLYVIADYLDGEISHTEHDRADCWQWFDINQLPSPLFLPLQILFRQHTGWLRSVGIIE